MPISLPCRVPFNVYFVWGFCGNFFVYDQSYKNACADGWNWFYITHGDPSECWTLLVYPGVLLCRDFEGLNWTLNIVKFNSCCQMGFLKHVSSLMESLFFRFHKSSNVICNPSTLNYIPLQQPRLISSLADSKRPWIIFWFAHPLFLCILCLQDNRAHSPFSVSPWLESFLMCFDNIVLLSSLFFCCCFFTCLSV